MGFSGSQDRADESMLESHVGDRGNGLLFFRSNRSPGNMSHSRITSYSLVKYHVAQLGPGNMFLSLRTRKAMLSAVPVGLAGVQLSQSTLPPFLLHYALHNADNLQNR